LCADPEKRWKKEVKTFEETERETKPEISPAGQSATSSMRRLFSPFVVVALFMSSLPSTSAFTAKKCDPAFKAKEESPPRGSASSSASSAPSQSIVGQPHSGQQHQHKPLHSTANHYAFAPAVVYYQVPAEDNLDDEVVVSYATALISCAVTLAIGFGLGYGT
jgi:hypothetical protein